MTASNQQNAGQQHISAKEDRKVAYNDYKIALASPAACPWALLPVFFQLRKPLIERKRRERINHCLDQLRQTVVGVFRLDVSKPSRSSRIQKLVKHSLTHLVSYEYRTEMIIHILSFKQQSKLEKADILEMTVKHLQNIQSNKHFGEWILFYNKIFFDVVSISVALFTVCILIIENCLRMLYAV